MFEMSLVEMGLIEMSLVEIGLVESEASARELLPVDSRELCSTQPALHDRLR